VFISLRRAAPLAGALCAATAVTAEVAPTVAPTLTPTPAPTYRCAMALQGSVLVPGNAIERPEIVFDTVSTEPCDSWVRDYADLHMALDGVDPGRRLSSIPTEDTKICTQPNGDAVYVNLAIWGSIGREAAQPFCGIR
jgi:hypothetical protein